ncbi:MAG TPA: hypothetical protein DCY79_11545 [Planctomycetaceae bacterium]|nr:hypothetical protein [Planctomycetaceae bacterium]
MISRAPLVGLLMTLCSLAAADTIRFEDQIAPIFEKRCVSCHNDDQREGGLSLVNRAAASQGGESGPLLTAENNEETLLLEYVSGDDPEMPKQGPPLAKAEIALLRQWLAEGAKWPAALRLKDRSLADNDWWSLKPLAANSPAVWRSTFPDLPTTDLDSPVDAFISRQHQLQKLSFAPPADRRTLLRRLSFDLIGLPPTPANMQQFLTDTRPDAYERQVDRLLASPHYGERWARHWLDIVHYGDTHGYDKDKLRPNAWPYRDYVIRSLNADKPYARFVREQLAGDVLWPGTIDGIEATGFISAGPWDFIGHAEVPESKIDGKVARHLDRDDMIRTVFESLCSTTVGCAQCHHHKFDPISMQDYYNLQSIFAAIDRAERTYDRDPESAERRAHLAKQLQATRDQHQRLTDRVNKLSGPALAALDKRIAQLTKERSEAAKPKPEFGYHSRIESKQNVVKWVQVDLGASQPLNQVILVGCHDSFGNIGAGFGFPKRFRIESSDDPKFEREVQTIADHTSAAYKNPGVTPQIFSANGISGRYIRVTATQLVNRQPTDYIMALGELMAINPAGTNMAAGRPVSSLDSIEAPVRWRRSNLTDGYYYGIWNNIDLGQLAALSKQRDQMIAAAVPAALRKQLAEQQAALARLEAQLKSLPAKSRVFVGCVHAGNGNFAGRAGKGPREIRVLHRGQVTQPRQLAVPGTIDIIPDTAAIFELPEKHPESARRIALADWIIRHDHPLTWRSIVNRFWQYHFGRALVDSPNDFGRMGHKPTHPLLLDWLALRFRDEGQSTKRMHRLLVTSRVYRQSSYSTPAGLQQDAENRFLWRMNRRKLEAEALRDTVLMLADRWNTRLGGPGFRDFVLERPEHSPHYEYHKHDPLDPATHRRSIYRFLVRSQPQPFMEALDCADPSQMVDKRNETVTALQSLAMLNNAFMVAMSEQFANRLTALHPTLTSQLEMAFQLTLNRSPTSEERAAITAYATEFGLANTCRILFNMNEFSFVD